MAHRYAKTLLFVALGSVVFLSSFAINVLSDDFGKVIAAYLGKGAGGEQRAGYLLWFVVVISFLVFVFVFLQEHNAPTATTQADSPNTTLFPPEDYQNRQNMLKKLRDAWITRVLHRSLWNEVVITLGLTLKPDAVISICDLAQRRIGQSDEPLPRGKPILEIYEEQNGELLILGEPGAGKTTLLLTLTEKLLNIADANDQHPIPIILNLSTWNLSPTQKSGRRKKNKTNGSLFAAWVTERLNREYEIPLSLAERWIESGSLLLLLDGLDEVAPARQADCVAAINAYRQHHSGLRPMVICCRSREYDAIPNLHLHGAIVVQPLNREQVNTFLKEGKNALVSLRKVIRATPDLYEELFTSPLCLHVAAITYANRDASELMEAAVSEERFRRLWNAYIKEMFQRKQERAASLYPKDRALDWLRWLAYRMTQTTPTVFRIEEMQIDTLLSVWQRVAVVWLPCIFAYFSTYKFNLGQSITANLLLAKISNILLASLVAWAVHDKTINAGVSYRLTLGNVKDKQKIKKALRISFIWFVFGGLFAVLMCLREGQKTMQMAFFVLVFGAGTAYFSVCYDLFLNNTVIEQSSKPNANLLQLMKNGVAVTMFMFLMPFPILFLLLKSTGHEIFIRILPVPDVCYASAELFLVFGGATVVRHYLLRLFLWLSGTFPRNITIFFDYCEARVLVRRENGGWRFIHGTLQAHFAMQYRDAHPEISSPGQLPQ